MKFENYDRVVDNLMYLSDTITLKFTVVLAKTIQRTNSRRFFQYEVEKASKFAGGEATRNINRNMTFFFTIDIKDEFGSGFVIKPGDTYMLLDMINKKVLPWYYAESSNNAYQYINNTLALKEYTPATYTQSDIRYLSFEPSVIHNTDGQFSYGCKININGRYNIEITLEQLMEFIQFLHTDMYAVACSLVNFAKTQPYGTNLYSPYGLGGGKIDDGWNSAPTDYSNNSGSKKFKDKGKKGNGSNSFLDSI